MLCSGPLVIGRGRGGALPPASRPPYRTLGMPPAAAQPPPEPAPPTAGPSRGLMYVLIGGQQLFNTLIRQSLPTLILFMGLEFGYSDTRKVRQQDRPRPTTLHPTTTPPTSAASIGRPAAPPPDHTATRPPTPPPCRLLPGAFPTVWCWSQSMLLGAFFPGYRKCSPLSVLFRSLTRSRCAQSRRSCRRGGPRSAGGRR